MPHEIEDENNNFNENDINIEASALDLLRMQLTKDYPDDKPVFKQALKSPEERKRFFENVVLPPFEKIRKAFEPFHFNLRVSKFSFVTRIDIKDGCSSFSCAIKISRKFACAALVITYRDDSICPYNFENVLLEEKYDLSRISQDLPEELIITIFSDFFINRKTYLKRIVDKAINDKREKDEFLRAERRAKLVILKHNNEKFDPNDAFETYLDSPEFEGMRTWLDASFDLEDM